MGNSVQKVAFPAPYPPTPLPRKYKYHWLKTPNNHRLPLVYFKYPKAKLTLVFSHGNAMDLGLLVDYLKYLSKKLKVSVIGYDYLGYGESKLDESSYYTPMCTSSSRKEIPEHPSEKGTYESVITVYEYITKVLKIPNDQLVWLGQSIGSGPTTEICSKTPCAGVILVTPFRSAAKVVTNSSLAYPVDFFRNEGKISKIKSPVLLIHGTKDNVISMEHSQILYKKLVEKNGTSQYPAVWIPGADHNDLDNFSQYYQALDNFLRHLETTR